MPRSGKKSPEVFKMAKTLKNIRFGKEKGILDIILNEIDNCWAIKFIQSDQKYHPKCSQKMAKSSQNGKKNAKIPDFI